MNPESAFLIAYATLIVGVVVMEIAKRYYDRRAEEKLVEEFSKSIVAGRRSGSLRSHKDIEKLYDGICSNQRAQDRICDLNKHLGQVNARIIQKNNKTLGDVKDDEVRSLTEFTTGAIDELQYELRFNELPEIERHLLSDAASFANNKDIKSVKNKLSEIATAIKARDEELSRAVRMEKIGFGLAIVGFIFTVVFGLT